MQFRVVKLLTYAAWVWWELACGGYANAWWVAWERNEAVASLFYAWHPVLLSPFLDWPVPANLMLICDLSSKYLPILQSLGLKTAGREMLARGCEYESDILLKSIKCIVFIRKFSITSP